MFFSNGGYLFKLLPCEHFSDRIMRGIDNQHFSTGSHCSSQLVKVDFPIIAGRFISVRMGVQWDVYGFSGVKGDRRKILVEERLEHDDFVTLFKESSEHRILSFVSTTSHQDFRLDI